MPVLPSPGGPARRAWGLTSAVPAGAGAADAVCVQIRAALADLWGVPVGPLGLAHHCPACGSTDHGAPRLIGLPRGRSALVSVTGVDVLSADDAGAHPVRVAAWWAPGDRGRPHRRGGSPGPGLGLDLERRDGPVFAMDDALGTVAFSPAERDWIAARAPRDRPAARACLWTRKEALAKAAGTGFTGDPADVDALAPCGGAALVDLPGGAVRGVDDGVVAAMAWIDPCT